MAMSMPRIQSVRRIHTQQWIHTQLRAFLQKKTLQRHWMMQRNVMKNRVARMVKAKRWYWQWSTATTRKSAAKAEQSGKKPNILCIWGDDIGTWNISHNNRGMMGYKTPNIDRIAREGVAFTDYYAQQSCTAGRAHSSAVASQ